MPTFEELKARYMITALPGRGGSLGSGTAPTPITTYTDCGFAPRIHGTTYFPDLLARINAVSGAGAYIYLANWACHPAFSLASPGGARLADLLKAKARAGVDVRFMGWVVAPELMSSRILRIGLSVGGASLNGVRGILGLNDETMNFALALRAEPALAHKAVLNILAHPAGAVHLKFALVGDANSATGFTGGIDLHPDRWPAFWHDVQARVDGPVCGGFFEAFRLMWNEVRARPVSNLTALTVTAASHTTAMPALLARTINSTGSGHLHMQSLRTLPQYNFSFGIPRILASNDPLSYAPNGLFEHRAAWAKALGAASQYIYMEDQSFSSQELFDLINGAILQNDGLRVVLVTGQPDPHDAPSSVLSTAFGIAVNDHLLRGLSAAQRDRIGIFSHRTNVIHTKSTIIDDNWAMVGSANAMRRSLYTDFEHSVAFMDPDNSAVAGYRQKLWQTHLRQNLDDPAAGLAAWFAIPYVGTPAAAASPIQLDRLRLPFASVSFSNSEQVLYDEVFDADSRQNWGGGLAALLTSSGSPAAVGSFTA